jgi:hypothetical protein
MNRNPSLFEGISVALLVALLVTGGIILTSYENTISGKKSVEIITTPPVMDGLDVTQTSTEVVTIPSVYPTPTVCLQPEGWEIYQMQIGDSLEGLAEDRLADLGEVMGANCLTLPGALPGSIIFLPPRPPTLTPTITRTPTITQTPTTTLRPCDYPAAWIRYELTPGDTLFKLGVRFHVSEGDLVTGNCISLGSALHPGDVLLVPKQPTVTPTPRK